MEEKGGERRKGELGKTERERKNERVERGRKPASDTPQF